MRFHRLTLTAFGPYPGTEEIDFESLNEAGVFLLTGKTGAGKTSLLDAVCFALYGVVPGERGVKSLRSHHAAPDARPEVVLELTLGERRLRVHRTPEWQRPKKRGEGTTRENAAARLVDLSHGDERLVSHRIQEVGHELRALLGMSSEQFMQVVLLPQGRFQTFLRATSDERQHVLETLFATERFSRIEDWMHQEARRLRENSAHGERRVAHLLGAVSNRAATALPPELVDLTTGAATEAGAAAARWAEDVVGTARDRAEAAAASAATAQSVLDDLTDRLARAERETAVVRRHAQASATLATLAGRAEELARVRDRLDAHGRAAAPSSLASALDRLDRDVEVARSSAGRSRRELEAHAGTTAGALEDRGAVRDSLVSRLAELRRLAPLVAETRACQARAEDAGRAAAQHADTLAGVEASLDAMPARRDALDAELDRARVTAATRDGAALQRRAARARLDAALALDAARSTHDEVAARALAAREEAATAHEEHLALLERRLLGMADELARQLQPGEPCTVCGSREHPGRDSSSPAGAPAGAPVTAPVTDDDQVVSQARRRRAQHLADEARAAAEGAATALVRLEQQAEGREPEQARADLDAAEAALATAEEAARSLPDLAHRLADLAAEQARLVEQRDHLRQLLREQEQLAAQLSETVATNERTLVEAAGAHVSVDEAIVHEQRTLSLLDALVAAERHLVGVEERREQAAAQADELAVAHGFADAASARAARMTASAVEQATVAVDAADRLSADARRTLEDPDVVALVDALAGQDPEDPSHLRAQCARAEAERTRLGDLRATTGDAAAALDRLATDLATALAAWAPHQERHATADRLSRLVRGTGADNQLQMRLSSYVLATRLDQVLDAANERLAQMRDHRYALRRTAHGRGGARAGLGLEVLDAWTGEARDAATLSGGETFVVSLALALGLADVVGEESGGTRVDTLFVDEGFSSLDPDTLDDVMDRIDALRAGGRTVGVVSHVSELRSRIPTQLHVESSRTGSTLTTASTVA